MGQVCRLLGARYIDILYRLGLVRFSRVNRGMIRVDVMVRVRF